MYAQCLATRSGACGGTTPVCGGADTCHGCARDADCAAMTCLPDGACAAPGSVLCAAADGKATAGCMPAENCSLARAIDLNDGTKSTIRIDPGPHDLATTLTLGVDMYVVGRGAVIDRNAGGTGGTPVIGGGASITLDYLAAATLATDIDEDDRPQGAGRDMGADEIK